MLPASYRFVAQAYGASNYGACAYQENTNCTSTTTSSTSGGSLVDTGTMVSAFVGIAAFIILLAVLASIWRRKKKSSASTTPIVPTDPTLPGSTGTAETISGEHRKI